MTIIMNGTVLLTKHPTNEDRLFVARVVYLAKEFAEGRG